MNGWIDTRKSGLDFKVDSQYVKSGLIYQSTFGIFVLHLLPLRVEKSHPAVFFLRDKPKMAAVGFSRVHPPL